VLNSPTELSTYFSVYRESSIDVCLVTRSVSNLVSDWDVKDWASSGHRAIDFVNGATGLEPTRPVRRVARYNCKKVDWDRFDETLSFALPDTLGGDCDAMVLSRGGRLIWRASGDPYVHADVLYIELRRAETHRRRREPRNAYQGSKTVTSSQSWWQRKNHGDVWRLPMGLPLQERRQIKVHGWEDSMKTMLGTLIRRDDPNANTGTDRHPNRERSL
jgi:hypothetical protein